MRYTQTPRTHKVEVQVYLDDDDVRPHVLVSDNAIEWLSSLLADENDPDAAQLRDSFREAAQKHREQYSPEDLITETAHFRNFAWLEDETLRERCLVKENNERSLSRTKLRQYMLRYLLVDWTIEIEADGEVVPLAHQDSEFGTKMLADHYWQLLVSTPGIAPIIDGMLVELERQMFLGEDREKKVKTSDS